MSEPQISTEICDGGVIVSYVNSTDDSLFRFSVYCKPKSSRGPESCGIVGLYLDGKTKKQMRFDFLSKYDYGYYTIDSAYPNLRKLRLQKLNLIKQCI